MLFQSVFRWRLGYHWSHAPIQANQKLNWLCLSLIIRKGVRMTLQLESPLDGTDWKILRELQQDARLSFNELGRRVALTAPAVAERVRKLEDRGIITGYGTHIDPAKV